MMTKHKMMGAAALTIAALTYSRNRRYAHSIKMCGKRHAMNKMARASRKRNRRSK